MQTKMEAPMEHERRFFPNILDIPMDFRAYPMSAIEQGYLGGASGVRLRSELKDDVMTFTQTRKTGEGVSRQEDEIEISIPTFIDMWENIECSLRKSRYYIPWENVMVELNIFHGTLSGYVQIEVEFNSHEEAIAFTPPEWFGLEVTDDKRHGNSTLAKNGMPK